MRSKALSKETQMRIAHTFAALALLCTVPASAQMPDQAPAPRTPQMQSPPAGSIMMCGPAGTTGQGQESDKTGKPMQMSMMCPCCQNMMKKGMMQKMQTMPHMKH